MALDIVAFDRKIFRMTLKYDDKIKYWDLKYLLTVERLCKLWSKPVSVYDVSYWMGVDRNCVYAFLRRCIASGYIIEIIPAKYEVTEYADIFIKRFSTKFNAFLSGKIQSPYD